MNEITRVGIENEMDLILAHKQSMRLAELAGLSLAAQTTFATAVSEVSRAAVGKENHASLRLYISDKKDKLKYITAVLEDERQGFSAAKDEGFNYARKLIQNITATTTATGARIELNYRLANSFRIDDMLIEKWRINFNNDPAVSPYEEIKRKNRQLIELADKLQESEQQYKALTDSLPVMIYSTTDKGVITYANQWLTDYSGQAIDHINETQWQEILHPDDFPPNWDEWKKNATNPNAVIRYELRLKNAQTGEYRWHTGISIAMTSGDGTINTWNAFMVDTHAQKLIEQTLNDNKELKEIQTQLQEKITQLNQSNEQLEQFAYVASHDLQEPLRKISFYSDFLQKKYASFLPQEASMFFNNLINATHRMKMLIQDVLDYSMVRGDRFTSVKLDQVISQIIQDLEISIEEKKARIIVDPLPVVEGNKQQLTQLFENLLSNSLKFSRLDATPVIAIRAEANDKYVTLYFSDNGIGFDEKYMDKIFSIFQRLHTREKYLGTGIGLALCKKIVELHNGTITAKGNPNVGSTFIITLPLLQDNGN